MIKFAGINWAGYPATNSQITETSELSWLNGGTSSKLLCSSKQGLLWPVLIYNGKKDYWTNKDTGVWQIFKRFT